MTGKSRSDGPPSSLRAEHGGKMQHQYPHSRFMPAQQKKPDSEPEHLSNEDIVKDDLSAAGANQNIICEWNPH